MPRMDGEDPGWALHHHVAGVRKRLTDEREAPRGARPEIGIAERDAAHPFGAGAGLAAPRPPSMSQMVQGSCTRARPGRRCSGRQRIGQKRRMLSKSASDQEAVASASLLLRDNPVKVASKLLAEFVQAAPGSVVMGLGVIER